MPRERDPTREPIVPAKVKVAIKFMIEQKADLVAAALAAGIKAHELRRSMGKPHVRRYSLEQRQIALEAFCLGSPAALTKVRDESENGMAIVNAIKAGEQLRVGAIETEASLQKRAPGLQIVIVTDGRQEIAYQPEMPVIEVTPVPVAEPVPAPSDVEQP